MVDAKGTCKKKKKKKGQLQSTRQNREQINELVLISNQTRVVNVNPAQLTSAVNLLADIARESLMWSQQAASGSSCNQPCTLYRLIVYEKKNVPPLLLTNTNIFCSVFHFVSDT